MPHLSIADTGTPHQKVCCSCGKPTERLCSGCRKKRYCSTECQRAQWTRHIFECNPRRPVTTADYLALAVFDNLIPTHSQTCEDYGFNRAISYNDRVHLFGLYIWVMKNMGVKPTMIHRWRVGGILVQEIKRLYDGLPRERRGGHYSWFLKNKHIIDASIDFDPHVKLHFDQFMRQAWAYAGGRPTDSAEAIYAALRTFDKKRRLCFSLCTALLSGYRPCPDLPDLYIEFGFCVCNKYSEKRLGGLYGMLTTFCTFDEIVEAYRSMKIFQLFLKYGFAEVFTFPHLEDFFQGSVSRWSVWILKASITAQKGSPHTIMPVAIDYGYVNCRDVHECEELSRVYVQVLETSDDAAFNLHNAAMTGRLFEHTSALVKLKRKEKGLFARLMRNPYVLLEPD